jgi:hypothetical protein
MAANIRAFVVRIEIQAAILHLIVVINVCLIVVINVCI